MNIDITYSNVGITRRHALVSLRPLDCKGIRPRYPEQGLVGGADTTLGKDMTPNRQIPATAAVLFLGNHSSLMHKAI